jgi:hypothetical protein
MAEAKAEADLKETLAYIARREAELSHYSDKLRNAVNRIANIFGSAKECQICNYYEYHYLHHQYRNRFDDHGFDELPETWNNNKVKLVDKSERPERWGEPGPYTSVVYFEKVENPHKFIPKIQVSIDVADEEPFLEDEVGKHYLAIRDHQLTVKVEGGGDLEYYIPIRCISRERLKTLVQSGRLTKFLQVIKASLEAKTDEYAKVSEIAEKLVSVLS